MSRRPSLPSRTLDATSAEGFTLVELMVAAMVLVIGILGTLTLLDTANARIQTTRQREAATNLARELAEAARAVPYSSLDTNPTVLQGTLQQEPGLADASSATPGWQL